MNSLCMTGRLTGDPEIKSGDNWTLAMFSIAVQRRLKNKDTGKYESDFFDCKAFGSTATFLEKFITKGTKIELTGQLSTEEWTSKDGQKRKRVVIIADNVAFAESKSASGGETRTQPTSTPQTGKADSMGFVSIPDGMQGEELPFV